MSRKWWHGFLIAIVAVLTLYHVLPTVLYYGRPLKEKIDNQQAASIAKEIADRVQSLDYEAVEWVKGFCKLQGIQPAEVVSQGKSIVVRCDKSEDALHLRQRFSGRGIPFAPAQMMIAPQDEVLKEVVIARRIPKAVEAERFMFAERGSDLYRQVVEERAAVVADLLGDKGKVRIDWDRGEIQIHILASGQELLNEVAKLSMEAGEVLTQAEEGYLISLHGDEASGFLVFDLNEWGQVQAQEVLALVRKEWQPRHPDMRAILDGEDKHLQFAVEGKAIAVYGIEKILASYESFPYSEPAQTASEDLRSLVTIFRQQGYEARKGEAGIQFVPADVCGALLAATRERFSIHGKFATLELSTIEERLRTVNSIETAIHEDLIKAHDEYNEAQVSLHLADRSSVPKPIRNILWNNWALSWKKYFRGDEKKVIRWGLDLSGGKSVQIELRDNNHRAVVDDAAIKQGINELYRRVNKMGVSEVSIRQVGETIVLDFPGSQEMSAAELIQASSMYFHVVNEKMMTKGQSFLQDVWSEAVATRVSSAQEIQAIAYKQLQSDRGKELRDAGLRLQDPKRPDAERSFDDSLSKIAILRGETWQGQNHPLLIVFNNYALEGSQLDSVQASYDPQKGNFLNFEVKGAVNRDALYAWTSKYSKDQVVGTELEEPTRGHGWRMAVVLNDTVISTPRLESAIRDGGMISGSFSQREVNQLVADLKAGSLSFTPHILSEKNVSPELGQKDRTQGIAATMISLVIVIVSMLLYYRFAGLVASAAVFFNLFILWATLQNLGAVLSLAGIAGVILTIGMSIDANVLVFERIKEEFAATQNIRSAIQAGYQKAYSAIIDSNLTTIIVALILLNFDAGPIKGFAITLIIGIVSSMFTALFVTRFYFSGWLQNPKHTVLNMANWIHSKSIDFLRQAKPAFSIAILLIVAGSYCIYAKRSTIFGMDFTGGYSLYVEMEPLDKKDYIHEIEEALLSGGASRQDFQVRTLNPSNHLRVLLGSSMEEAGKPFFQMPMESEAKTNPRIDWVLTCLKDKGLALTKSSLSHIRSDWTAMSGQMSDSMRNNAVIGLLIALVCIFIYIAFRFEYKFAAASVICLLHDVFITVGLIGLLHAFGVSIQIDLNTVAAMMTIVGYSLNDTIIIFDRIREEMRLMRHRPLSLIINQSLNATLGRTTITSGTTLLVLLSLVLFGGPSIFSFALVMTLGVIFGTLSSWYIAAPLMLFFHRREEKKLLGSM